ncbi:helicase, putative [Schistosoma mansoni]|uniref:helicase, putative n=1 Tax=Schistosoma mansoni TaxID=6183 RepID=UPI00019B3662|nr:helicase, putative [Schistosoma mansoni]|eukprot:XP_018647384.1 helicase, putative [Schistosoma mansoni]
MFGRSFFFFSILILCWSCIFINLLSLSYSVAFEVRSFVHNDKVIDGGAHNVFWFVHITDLHFSEFGSKDRQMNFFEFCSTYIPVIRPEIVIASGDITDGKGKTFSSSSQNPEEWRDYLSLLEQSGVLNLTRWFDVRGNHDSFGVPSFGGDGDYYSRFGVRGRFSFRSNIFKLVKPYGQYSFISIDLSTEPGLKWPLNFFGSFNLNVKTQFSKSIDKAKDSNQTDNAFAYLCGHLHTLFGLAKKMYFLQPQGYWEWELGDWRDNRYFRIVAVDNDLVSFVDVRKFSLNDSNKEWPIILITNPKNANFLLPRKEPFHRIEFSTHIR